MVSVVVIDDELKARDTIIKILAMSTLEIQILGEASSVESAYEMITLKSPDIVLLDINLPDGSGFDLLKKFDAINFKTVFITAHVEHAIRAFKYSAIDYILKPIIASDLLGAVDKAHEAIMKEDTALKIRTLLSNLDTLKKIILKTAESIHIVNIQSIVRCQADINYTTFYLSDKKKLLVSKPLKEYDELLTPSGFFRTHQSHLVNLDHILRYDKWDGGYLVMNDQSLVPVSTRRKEELFRLFDMM